MKTIAICLTICLVSYLAFTEYRRVEERKIAAAQAIATQLAAERERANAHTAPANERAWSYMPQTGRWVEHDRSVSAMQSVGGGGNFAGPRPTPKPSASDEIKKAWGFGKTKLDEPARR